MLTDQIKTVLDSALQDIFNLFSGKTANLRYPLEDQDKFANAIKFTALARIKKSSNLDFAAPQYTQSTLGSAILYMPSNIQVNDILSYDNADTGIGGMALNAATGSASTSEFLKGLGKSSDQLVDRYISQKLADMSQNRGMIGGAAGQALINRGEVVNPHTQMLFRAPALRQFNFNFRLMPRSSKEAKEIIRIIQFFRLAAYPELGTEAVSGGGTTFNMATFKFPEVFEIKYISNNKENKKMIKFQQSYLTSVSINYNPTSPTFFEDGMPSEIDLSLTFQETKALDRKKIAEGY